MLPRVTQGTHRFLYAAAVDDDDGHKSSNTNEHAQDRADDTGNGGGGGGVGGVGGGAGALVKHCASRDVARVRDDSLARTSGRLAFGPHFATGVRWGRGARGAGISVSSYWR